MKYAVKYCGGCNPRYDRTAMVKKLEQRLGQSLMGIEEGLHYDVIYVICGCTARCADISHLSAERNVIIDNADPILNG